MEVVFQFWCDCKKNLACFQTGVPNGPRGLKGYKGIRAPKLLFESLWCIFCKRYPGIGGVGRIDFFFQRCNTIIITVYVYVELISQMPGSSTNEEISKSTPTPVD